MTYFVLIALFLLPFVNQAYALTASRFIIVKESAATIDPAKDHYSVSVVGSWTSSSDNFFKSLVSEKNKLTVTMQTQLGFFDETDATVTYIGSQTDMTRVTGRSWGVNVNLLDSIPADARTKLTIQLVIDRGNRFTPVLSAISGQDAGIVPDILSAEYLGYAKAASAIIGKLVRAENATIPFDWNGNVELADVKDATGKLKEHYLVLIAPSKDGDETMSKFSNKNLSFDDGVLTLTNQTVIKDHSYVVFQVKREPNPDILQQINASTKPWAVLFQDEFIYNTAAAATNLHALSLLEQAFMQQLKTGANLIKTEKRFSKFDRAIALSTLCSKAISSIEIRGARLKIASGDFPTDNLKRYLKSIRDDYHLDRSHDEEFAKAAGKIADIVINAAKAALK